MKECILLKAMGIKITYPDDFNPDVDEICFNLCPLEDTCFFDDEGLSKEDKKLLKDKVKELMV